MKKLFIIIASQMLLTQPYAQAYNGGDNLPLTIKTTNPEDVGGKPVKSPIQIPIVYLDGNALSFDSSIEGCTIQLLDEDENVIFSHFIEENETSLTLPSYLSGTYELQIIRGNITFYAFIEL